MAEPEARAAARAAQEIQDIVERVLLLDVRCNQDIAVEFSAYLDDVTLHDRVEAETGIVLAFEVRAGTRGPDRDAHNRERLDTRIAHVCSEVCDRALDIVVIGHTVSLTCSSERRGRPVILVCPMLCITMEVAVMIM